MPRPTNDILKLFILAILVVLGLVMVVSFIIASATHAHAFQVHP